MSTFNTEATDTVVIDGAVGVAVTGQAAGTTADALSGTDGPRVRDPSHWVFAKLFIGHDGEPATQRSDRADDLLSRRFAPLFAQWGAQGLRSFFIRYHEDGYHLRLRVFAADDGPRQQARQQLLRLLRALRPAGTRWKLATYAPELEKYGGPLGNYWAEQHFHASSALVLQLLQRLAALPAAERVAMRSQLAIVLMHATLAGAGLNEQDTSSLCSGYYRYWWRNASGGQAPVDALEPLYQRHKALLLHCLGDGQAEAVADSAWARQHPSWRALVAGWTAQIQADVMTLSALEETGRLLVPGWLRQASPDVLGGMASRPCTLLEILPNYLHMLNNRLGVHVGNEGRLAYCLMRHLEDQRGLRAHPLDLLLQP